MKLMSAPDSSPPAEEPQPLERDVTRRADEQPPPLGGDVVSRVEQPADRGIELLIEFNRRADARADRADERFDEYNRRADERFAEFNRRADKRFDEYNRRADERLAEYKRDTDKRFNQLVDLVVKTRGISPSLFAGIISAAVVLVVGLATIGWFVFDAKTNDLRTETSELREHVDSSFESVREELRVINEVLREILQRLVLLEARVRRIEIALDLPPIEVDIIQPTVLAVPVEPDGTSAAPALNSAR